MKVETPKSHASAQREPLRAYFEEAATLRWCLAYNEDDYNFAYRDDGRIVYLFDANVVRFFVEPEKEAGKIIPFKAGRHGKIDYAAATALITAEFLFSRELAGQRQNPPFIAPAHGDDLAGILGKIDTDAKQRKAEEKAPERHDHALTNIVNRIRNKQYKNLSEAANALRQVVPGTADILVDHWATSRQFRRIYDDDLLRPLSLHTSATRDILYLDRQKLTEKKDWTRRIAAEPHAHGRKTINNERDAEALVQVMKLDADAAEGVRYVLITADMAVFNAYAKWYWNEAEPDPKRRFVLRIPLQYVPILNNKEMPNWLSESNLTARAYSALDSLFANLRSIERAFPQKLAYYRLLLSDGDSLERLYGFDPLKIDPQDRQTFSNTRARWDHVFQNGVVLNSPLMERRHKQEFEELVAILRENASLLQAIESDQEQNLSRIIDAHAEFTTKINLIDLTDGGAEIPPHRTPFLIRTEHPQIPVRMVELMRGERAVTDTAVLLRDAWTALGHGHTDLSLLLATVIAFRRGHWVAARIYAEDALDIDRKSRLRAEFEYLLAASARYMLGMLDDSRSWRVSSGRADLALAASIADGEANGDVFAVLRARLESCALQFALNRRRVLCDRLSHDELNEAAQQMNALIATVLALRGDIGTRLEDGLAPALGQHASLLTIGAMVFREFFLDVPKASFDRKGLAAAVDTLRRSPFVESGAPINQAHFVLADDVLLGHAPTAVAGKLEKIIGAAKNDLWLSRLDKLEIERLLAEVRAKDPLGQDPG